jgi:hypothetical protein
MILHRCGRDGVQGSRPLESASLYVRTCHVVVENPWQQQQQRAPLLVLLRLLLLVLLALLVFLSLPCSLVVVDGGA